MTRKYKHGPECDQCGETEGKLHTVVITDHAPIGCWLSSCLIIYSKYAKILSLSTSACVP